MKKNILSKTLTIILASACLVPVLALTLPSAGWFRQHIDQRLSLEFPNQPIGNSGGGTTLYYFKAPEASYLGTAIHYNSQPHLKPITDPYPYYVRMLKSQLTNEVMVDSQIRSSKGTLVDSASFTLDNYKGLQFAITSLHPDGKTLITRTKRVIFIDGWVYQAEHLPLAPVTKASQEKRKKFFESMRLTHM